MPWWPSSHRTEPTVSLPRPAPVALALLLLAGTLFRASAAPPLRTTIDAELKAAWTREKVTPAGRATDGEFLRRVHLDLVGTVPTTDEAAAFLADTDPEKRAKLVDRLLSDPRFATAQADVWDSVLFGRRPGFPDATRKRDTFKDWLAKSFADGIGHDARVRELLRAESPGPALYLVQYRSQPEEAAVAISRTFLGTQLQCARCHDHPYDKWTQKDFYGVAGFFVRLVVQESGSGTAKTYAVAEKSVGEVLFSGAAKDQAPGKKGEPVRPRFLDGPDLDEPPAPKDAPPFKEGTPLPKPAFSRKEKFADWLTTADNPYFARATVNRVWAQFMGRGIVHPIDDFQAGNEPSHPALLRALSDGLVEHKFDLKWLIREIVNSESYQLSGKGGSRDASPKWFERARVRPLSAEETVAAMRVVTGFDATLKPGEKVEIGWDYFMRAFGEPLNGQGDFQGSLAEHLFMNNGEHVRRFITRRKGNLVDTLAVSTDSPEKKAERLFLAILHRQPSPREREAFAAYLATSDKPEPAAEQAVWALLSTSEFRFNH